MTPTCLRIIREEHASLAAMLRSLLMMTERGPGDEPERFFDVVRAMLFYIDEFPERQHHPKESDLLFPKVVRAAPQCMASVKRLEDDHLNGEANVRALQHLLTAWELLGDARRATFVDAVQDYVAFYLEHMRIEESDILPLAQKVLQPEDWAELDAAFASNKDPLSGDDPAFNRLFTRVVMNAPAPVGLGSPERRARAA